MPCVAAPQLLRVHMICLEDNHAAKGQNGFQQLAVHNWRSMHVIVQHCNSQSSTAVHAMYLNQQWMSVMPDSAHASQSISLHSGGE